MRWTPDERLTMYLPRMMILPAAVSVMLDSPQRKVSCFSAVTTSSSGLSRGVGAAGAAFARLPLVPVFPRNVVSRTATGPPRVKCRPAHRHGCLLFVLVRLLRKLDKLSWYRRQDAVGI